MCDCHNSDAEHEVEVAEQQAYWLAYFGGKDVIRRAVDEERFYREYDHDPEEQRG